MMRLHSKTFGRRLAAIRIDRGLTQAELALLVGCSRQTICHWEKHGTPIEPDDVANCARALHCRKKDLLASVEEQIPAVPALWFWSRHRQLRTVANAQPPNKNQLATGGYRQLTTGKQAIPQPAKRKGFDAEDELLAPLDRIRGLLDKCSQDDLETLVEVIIEKAVEAAIDHRPTAGQNGAKYDA
jgi:transcriptional regulator with XRE-family HTH domain